VPCISTTVPLPDTVNLPVGVVGPTTKHPPIELLLVHTEVIPHTLSAVAVPDTHIIGPQIEVIAHMLFPLTIPPPHIFESAQTVPPVITFAPLIWSEEHIAPSTESLHPGVVVPIPMLPSDRIVNLTFPEHEASLPGLFTPVISEIINRPGPTLDSFLVVAI
jgi:hypothetical protein